MAKSRSRSKKNNRKTKSQPLIQLSLDQKLDIIGVLLFGVAAVTVFSMFSSSQGDLTSWWLNGLRSVFGLGIFVVPIALGLLGLWLLLRSFERTPRLSVEQLIGLLMAFLLALMTLSEFNTAEALLGGTVGKGLMQLVDSAVGWIGTIVLLVVGWLIAIVLLFDVAPSEIAAWFAKLFRQLRGSSSRSSGGPVDIVINPGRSTSNGGANGNGARAAAVPTRSANTAPTFTPVPSSTADQAASARAPRVTPKVRPDVPPPGMLGDQSMANPVAAEAANVVPDMPASGPLYPHIIGGEQAWELPKIDDIFKSGEDAAISEDDLRGKARIIEDTLHSFGVEGKVIEVNRGPAVTQFGVEPGFVQRAGKTTKVKVSKISALADDLALALAAKTIRIEAPVPGRSIVGIEVPNGEIAVVALRDVMESEPFEKITSPLRIALGQDVSGQSVAADLATMPHLLIAGTTGSGKSVCVNSIISCIMAHNTPDEVKLLMVDPKRVELTTYNGVPHLIAPVIVDLERVVGVLQWVTREMDERYRKFAKSGARNIDDYNVKITASPDGAKLPYIIVIIDELADLMMLAPDETEKTICRLAQMARATGIHLIIATQRPSVDVVTGLIKANFPARIAFSVASSVDSRVILDTTGAERLLGRGDMLYVAPEIGAPQRLQGCFVSDTEIHNLVRYWKGIRGTTSMPVIPVLADQQAVQQPFDALRAELDQASANGEDDLLQRAIDVVRVQRKASISLLQRQLRIGYTRAARLIDLMEERGIVGPSAEGNRWREVLFDSPVFSDAQRRDG
jgi:S-DNA-T family DNA segregation ATPase FtsK/SpoIIIE